MIITFLQVVKSDNMLKCSLKVADGQEFEIVDLISNGAQIDSDKAAFMLEVFGGAIRRKGREIATP